MATAVLDLLAEGHHELGIAEVAERAGVHRSTVYRRWPTRGDLLKEALSLHTSRLVVPDTGSWAADVSELVGRLAEFLSDPIEISMSVVLASRSDPEMIEAQLSYWVPLYREMTLVVQRAISRGEVGKEIHPEAVIDLLLCPLIVRTVLLRETLQLGYLEELIGMIINLGTSGWRREVTRSRSRGARLSS